MKTAMNLIEIADYHNIKDVIVNGIVIFRDNKYYFIRIDPKTEKVTEEVEINLNLKSLYIGG